MNVEFVFNVSWKWWLPPNKTWIINFNTLFSCFISRLKLLSLSRPASSCYLCYLWEWYWIENEYRFFVCHCWSISLLVAFIEFGDKAFVPVHSPELISVTAHFFWLLWAVPGDAEMTGIELHSFVHWDDPDADICLLFSHKLIISVPAWGFLMSDGSFLLKASSQCALNPPPLHHLFSLCP